MHDGFREREVSRTRCGLVAELQHPRAAAKAGVRDAQRVEAARRAESRVDDRVEGAQTASARPALPRFRSLA
jgi:hypothetical protein